MVETLSRADESKAEIKDSALDRAEVGHIELESFTSSIVGVTGNYPLGSFAFPTGGFHQTFVGTDDGKLTELFWRPGGTVNQEELFNFSRISVPSKISAVASYYSDNDGFHHQDVTTEDGGLHELFWRPGPGVNVEVLEDFTSGMVGVAAFYTPDGYRRVIVATSDGNLTELSWKPRAAIDQTQIPHALTKGVVGVAWYFSYGDNRQHVILATEDNKVHDLKFGSSPTRSRGTATPDAVDRGRRSRSCFQGYLSSKRYRRCGIDRG